MLSFMYIYIYRYIRPYERDWSTYVALDYGMLFSDYKQAYISYLMSSNVFKSGLSLNLLLLLILQLLVILLLLLLSSGKNKIK